MFDSSKTTSGCPICGKPNLDENGKPLKVFPFCCARCKDIDLDNWLSGRYFNMLTDPDPSPGDEEREQWQDRRGER
jgi:endogenous inhibitor of DNA gyrase (YacG/DUF329 family)